MTEKTEDDSSDESDGEHVSIHDNSKGFFFFMVAQNSSEEKEEEVPKIEVDLLEEYNYLSSRFDEERKEKEEAQKKLREANEKIAQMHVRLEELEGKLSQFVSEKDSHYKLECAEVQNISSRKLDEIISSQRPTHVKFDLGYKGEKGSSSKSISPSNSTSQSVKEISVSPISSTIFKEPEILKKKHIRPESASKLPSRLWTSDLNLQVLGDCLSTQGKTF